MTTRAFNGLVLLAGAITAAMLPTGMAAQATSARPVQMREAWRFEAGKSPFAAPHSLVLTGECEVWIADATSGVWRVPCAGGTPQRVGAIGSGAGEYREPWLIARAAADSVAVYDRHLEQVLNYVPTGATGSVRAVRLSANAFGSAAAISFAGGTMRAWLTQFPNVNDPEGLHSLVVRVHASGTSRDTVALFDGIPSVYWGSGFSGSRIPVPYAPRPIVVFARDGGFFSGNTHDARVSVRDSAGRELRSLRLGIPEPAPLSRGDRDAYADSVRVMTDAEMEVLHYNAPERTKYRLQIQTFVKEDAVFPAARQRYDRLVLDENERSIWALLPGTGKSYTRTWEVFSTSDGSLERRLTVPHKGAVVDAEVKAGSIYVIEQILGGAARVAKYAPQQ